jgi:hypothetical protein
LYASRGVEYADERELDVLGRRAGDRRSRRGHEQCEQ